MTGAGIGTMGVRGVAELESQSSGTESSDSDEQASESTPDVKFWGCVCDLAAASISVQC